MGPAFENGIMLGENCTSAYPNGVWLKSASAVGI
jgi:hypothetical protein